MQLPIDQDNNYYTLQLRIDNRDKTSVRRIYENKFPQTISGLQKNRMAVLLQSYLQGLQIKGPHQYCCNADRSSFEICRREQKWESFYERAVPSFRFFVLLHLDSLKLRVI